MRADLGTRGETCDIPAFSHVQAKGNVVVAKASCDYGGFLHCEVLGIGIVCERDYKYFNGLNTYENLAYKEMVGGKNGFAFQRER